MKNKYIQQIAIIVPILLAVICLALAVKENNQAGMPVPKAIAFSGEYSYDGEVWYPYSADGDMSALAGNVRVKGHMNSDIQAGTVLNFFCNHIGVSVYVNGEMLYIDTPSELYSYGMDLMSSMCGKRWGQMISPGISTEDEIEFRLINYHTYGNKNAYKEALSSLLLTPQNNTVLEVYLQSYMKPFEFVGYALMIVAVLMLGAALSAVVLRSSMGKRIVKAGFAILFAGGYMLFDTITIYFFNELLVVKSYGSRLCLMLTIYFIGLMICDLLSDMRRKAASAVMLVSGIVNLLIVIIAISGNVLLYDMRGFWETAQLLISPVLIVLCVIGIKKEKGSKIELIVYAGMNVAIILDVIGGNYRMYYSGICFKAAFVVALIVCLAYGTKQIALDYQAARKNKLLNDELEKSRISIMLSQIQPHFLFNSLTVVMDLCDQNPAQAKAAIADFADYLRGNLASLKTENLISFATELEHIKKYLRLEKLRFQDELNVVYDIQSSDFMLPVLSVQPLIENAVKHGIGQKPGGGTVTIHTSEEKNHFLIRITDDGIGFSEGECADNGGTHVGIENAKKRLNLMLNARLEIDSKKGAGTTVSILIPKRRE